MTEIAEDSSPGESRGPRRGFDNYMWQYPCINFFFFF